MKKLFGSKTPVTQVSLSANELVSVLDKKYALKPSSKNLALEEVDQIRKDAVNTYKNLVHLNLETAKENAQKKFTSVAQQSNENEAEREQSSLEAKIQSDVAKDLIRYKPEIQLYKNKKICAQLATPNIQDQEAQLAWFKNTMEILEGNNPRVTEFFSYLAQQNMMNSAGNMVQLLCKLENDSWIPKFINNKKASKIIADENEINFYIKTPIDYVTNSEEEVIKNKDDSPIGSVTIHLKVDTDKQNEPRHRIVYYLTATNEEFRKKIVQPLYDKVEQVRKESMKPSASSAKPATKEEQSNEQWPAWHIMK